jgi:hypothetical protein
MHAVKREREREREKSDMSIFFAFVKLRIRCVQWHFINAPLTVLVCVVGFFSMEQHYMYYKTYIAYYTLPIVVTGARGGVVVKALRYKPAGRGLIPNDIILSVALWPWGRLSL